MMKKLSYFAALAAVIVSVSCQKEDTSSQNLVKDPVFTAIIADNGTKTSLELASKKVSWTLQDEITVTDSESPANSVKYVVTSIAESGEATFEKKSGESGTLGKAPYSATYGQAPSTSQTYGTTVTNLPMSAVSETTKLIFTVTCGLFKVTLTEEDQSIKSVAVSDGTTTYTLTCESPVSIESGAAFCIAVPAGTYTGFTFINSGDTLSTRTGLDITVEENHIKPVNSSFSPKYTEGGYTDYGIYAAHKWWAPVNCGYDESHPYGSIYQWGRKYGQAYELGDITPTDMTKEEGQSEEYKDKFGKAVSTGYYVLSWSSDGIIDNTMWNGSTRGTYDPCPSGWRVPTKDELKNLTDSDRTWTTLSPGGLFGTSPDQVFLPAAGQRNNNGEVGLRSTKCLYWTSTASNKKGASCMSFSESDSEASYTYISIPAGFSVRCVHE